MYYSSIRHIVLWYSACTTPVFGTSTGVVHTEYWYDMDIFALVRGADCRIEVRAMTNGKADRPRSLIRSSFTDIWGVNS